ncbi:MAG: AIR carboxylase family protein [Patescibacteria group bacterium]
MATVAVVLGSKSDKDAVSDSGMLEILQDILGGRGVKGLSFETSICSAHRNPASLQEYAEKALENGTKVFVGVAGMAAALPGALAGCTGMTVPVIAVPLDEHGIDSCLYMPPGVPVLTTGVGKPGLRNAAIAACQILSTGDGYLSTSLVNYLADNEKKPEFGVNL